MKIEDVLFGVIDWAAVEPTEFPGATGVARWRTHRFGDLRVRMVEYSAGYAADHWCTKGHVVLCLQGELETELADGRKFALRQGMSYHVADDTAPHRSSTVTGATLFIVD